MRADIQSQCEEESTSLRGTLYHNNFIKDCVDSVSWSTTSDIQANAWYKCKDLNKFSSYDECLNNNRIYRTSMIDAFDCYYKELKVLSSEGYNKYRYAKTDALYYNASESKLYEIYSKCLDGKDKLIDTNESVKFYECVAQKMHKEASSLMLKEWRESPNYKQDFEECKKAIPKEFVSSFLLTDSISADGFLPYVKCVFGRMGILENDCFYVDRLVSASKKIEVSNTEIFVCFNKAIGVSSFELVDLWNCLVQKNIIQKFDIQ